MNAIPCPVPLPPAVLALAYGAPVPLAFQVAAVVQAVAGEVSVTIPPPNGPLLTIHVQGKHPLSPATIAKLAAILAPMIPAGSQLMLAELAPQPAEPRVFGAPLARVLLSL